MEKIDWFFVGIVAFLLVSIPLSLIISNDKWETWKTEIEPMNCDELESHYVEDELSSSQETYLMKQLVKMKCLR